MKRVKETLNLKKKKDEINNNKYCFLIESIYTNTHIESDLIYSNKKIPSIVIE